MLRPRGKIIDFTPVGVTDHSSGTHPMLDGTVVAALELHVNDFNQIDLTKPVYLTQESN